MHFNRNFKPLVRKIFIFFTLLFLFQFFSFAQSENTKDKLLYYSGFFKALYNFEFLKADSIIHALDGGLKDPSDQYFLKAHYMRWYYLPIHQQSDEILSQYIQFLEAANNEIDAEEVNYIYINSALLKAEFNYNQGNYYKAFQNGVKVYDLVKNRLESKPDRVELKFLASLYHYYFQYYKSENLVFNPLMWFFKAGNKETGLRWLEEAAQDNSIIGTEALVYLSHIYLRIENKPSNALGFANQLVLKHPKNLKFYELLIEAHLANTIESEESDKLVKLLLAADKVYFQKYGRVYDAIFKSRDVQIELDNRNELLQNTLSFIDENGGGPHLKSLLFAALYKLNGDEVYKKRKQSLEVYRYQLTNYEE